MPCLGQSSQEHRASSHSSGVSHVQTSLLTYFRGMQNDAEKQRCVDMAAAEIQSILQGQRVQKGGPYQPASQRAFNAVGPPQQVLAPCQHLHSSPLMNRAGCDLHVFPALVEKCHDSRVLPALVPPHPLSCPHSESWDHHSQVLMLFCADSGVQHAAASAGGAAVWGGASRRRPRAVSRAVWAAGCATWHASWPASWCAKRLTLGQA